MSIAANFLIASGWTGQTTETLAYPPGALPVEQVVGVPLKSYVSASWTYYFKKCPNKLVVLDYWFLKAPNFLRASMTNVF